MTKREKLLGKARNNPAGLTFDEFEILLTQCGWIFKRQSGSHRLWMSHGGTVLPIQNNGGKAKAYQLKQAIRIMEENL